MRLPRDLKGGLYQQCGEKVALHSLVKYIYVIIFMENKFGKCLVILIIDI